MTNRSKTILITTISIVILLIVVVAYSFLGAATRHSWLGWFFNNGD